MRLILEREALRRARDRFTEEDIRQKQLHQAILEALRARDLPLAEEYLTNHILDAQQRAVMALETLRQENVE